MSLRTPDYERGPCRMWLADCRDILPHLSGVDCTVTSPPYNQRLDSFKASGFKAEGSAQWAERASSAYFDSLDECEYQEQQREILSLAYCATKSGGSLFYNHKCRWRNKEMLHPLDIVRPTAWSVRQEIIWARQGSLTQNAKMFPPAEERIIWCFKDSWRWNPESNKWLSVWRMNSVSNSEHPLEFPMEIPFRAIEATTELGDLVLDPFCGSATTGVACIRTGRQFIGIELDAAHFETAVARIDRELDQPRLFPTAPEVQQQAELFADHD